MAVIPDFKATTLTGFIAQHIAPGATIYTDGLNQLTGLPAKGYRHVPQTQARPDELRRGAPSVVPSPIEPSAICSSGWWEPITA